MDIKDTWIGTLKVREPKCQIFGTFETPITKTIPHQLFQISKNLRHGYSTVSNMRQYGHQCQTLFGLFNSFFLSPPIRCISRSLFVYISRSLCLAFLPRPLASPISPRRSRHRRSCHAERQRPPRLATDHWPTLRRRGTPVWRNGGQKWKLPSATATEAVWDVGFFDLMDVGLCRW